MLGQVLARKYCSNNYHHLVIFGAYPTWPLQNTTSSTLSLIFVNYIINMPMHTLCINYQSYMCAKIPLLNSFRIIESTASYCQSQSCGLTIKDILSCLLGVLHDAGIMWY